MKKFKLLFAFLLLAALLYIPVFGYLNSLTIRIWDEARLAVNAFEMLKNGNYIVTYYDGSPDMWNTKPPLMIWMQVLSMKAFGINELAIRIPSALAAFFTCIVLLIFSKKYLKNYTIGIIAVFVLITSEGYIQMHGTRTGDYDSLLTLFTTLSALLLFSYYEQKNTKHLYLFFLFLALGVLTKSVTGLLFLPAYIIYTLIQRELLLLLKNKHFYFGLFSFITIVFGYYLLRETYNPGYIDAVKKNELGGRYLEVLENHKHSFWYYYTNLLEFRFAYWFLLIPCGMLTGFFIKDQKIKKLSIYLTLLVITFFLIISTAQTKLAWYDIPLYPLLALIVSMFLYFIVEVLSRLSVINSYMTKNISPYLFLFFVGVKPYQQILNTCYKPTENSVDYEFYEIGYYLRDGLKGKVDLNKQFLLYDGYYAQNLFYINSLQEKGVHVNFKNWENLDNNDVVFAYQNHVKEFVEKNYSVEILNQVKNVVTYKIHGRN
jgi:4-amino-4-deoxy-L-arabinose transferase-like glycosyltransferase